jgi:hypothetical protein
MNVVSFKLPPPYLIRNGAKNNRHSAGEVRKRTSIETFGWFREVCGTDERGLLRTFRGCFEGWKSDMERCVCVSSDGNCFEHYNALVQ